MFSFKVNIPSKGPTPPKPPKPAVAKKEDDVKQFKSPAFEQFAKRQPLLGEFAYQLERKNPEILNSGFMNYNVDTRRNSNDLGSLQRNTGYQLNDLNSSLNPIQKDISGMARGYEGRHLSGLLRNNLDSIGDQSDQNLKSADASFQYLGNRISSLADPLNKGYQNSINTLNQTQDSANQLRGLQGRVGLLDQLTNQSLNGLGGIQNKMGGLENQLNMNSPEQIQGFQNQSMDGFSHLFNSLGDAEQNALERYGSQESELIANC